MVQDSPSRKMDQFIVRLPDGMRERIKNAADENNRSMNAEVVAALEEKFPAPPSGDFSLWLSLEKVREKRSREIKKLIETLDNMDRSPEYDKLNDELMDLFMKNDLLRDRQEKVLTSEMLMVIENLYEAGKLYELVEQADPLDD